MAGVKRFEDLEAWKRARVLTAAIYEATNGGSFARDFALRDQIRRAAISILSNIAEGFERESGDKDFRHFLSMAKGSAGEVRAQLYVALDAKHLSDEQFAHLSALVVEVSKLLSGFIAYLDRCIHGT
ncbi:MAG: four helix bundle protein [Gemmataceae bacterium]|nr:four helix bundle protein [Gemmataceae bacterium]